MENNSTKISQTHKIYFYRFIICGLFVVAGFANALVLLSFSPIASLAMSYWNGIDATAINLLAVSFQIFYIPGTMIGINVSKQRSVKALMMLGGLFTTIGCFVRWIGAYVYENHSPSFNSEKSYAIVLLGTFLVALSQPFYLNLPAKIAAVWFPVKERDLATTVCSLANPLGSALGSLLPPLFVTQQHDDSTVKGVSTLLLIQLLVSVVSVALIYLFFINEPPSPPSNTESQKIVSQTVVVGINGVVDPSNASRQTPTGSRSETTRSIRSDLRILMQNSEYLKLFISFSIAIGNLNAIATLIGQLPGGYSSSEYGTTGFGLILSGFLGSFLTGLLLDKTKSYRPILKSAWIFAVSAWILFVLSCRSGIFPFFISSAVILGFFILPIIPSTIMNAVECAYPIAEDLALGILYVGANTLAIAMTFIGQTILASSVDSAGPKPLYPFALWSVGTMMVGILPALYYNGKYLRLDEDLKALLIPGEEDNESKPDSSD